MSKSEQKIADITPINKLDCFIGKTFVKIDGMTPESREIIFTLSDGSVYKMDHYQDCCESVYLESVVGDVEDLLNTPILDATESSSSDTPPHFKHNYEPDSQTWTFYKFRTIKGYVDLRWFGESNGFYSESVDVELITAPHPLLPHEK